MHIDNNKLLYSRWRTGISGYIMQLGCSGLITLDGIYLMKHKDKFVIYVN